MKDLFELYLSTVLAHSCVYESGLEIPANLFQPGYPRLGEDPPAPSSGESLAESMRGYTQQLPAMIQAQIAAAGQYEPAMLALRQAISPQQNALDLQLYQQYGPEFARVAQQIAAQNAQSQATSDLALQRGTGRELVQAAMEAQRAADPEAYRARELGVEQLNRLNAGLTNPDAGLSESERMEIDRSLARDNYARGVGASPTANSTVANALAFGQAGEARRNQRLGAIANAAQISTQAVQPLSSRVDAFQLTTGRPSVTGQQQSGTREVGQDTNQMGQNLFDTSAQFRLQQNQINSQRRDSLDRTLQTFSAMPNVSCCWTFAAAYGGWDNIPEEVRVSRDLHYSAQRRHGYRKMSEWLVPKMKKSAVARALTHLFLIAPMTSHANWYVNRRGIGWLWTPLQQLYLAIWEHFGARDGIPPEVFNTHEASMAWNFGIYRKDLLSLPTLTASTDGSGNSSDEPQSPSMMKSSTGNGLISRFIGSKRALAIG